MPRSYVPPALEHNAITQAANRDVCDAQAGAVDRDKPIDLSLQAFAKQVLDAAQIAQALFADGADERDRPWCLNVAVDHRACHGEQHREPATIIANPGSAEHRALAFDNDVRAFGKHRVEMGAEHQMRTRLRAALLAEHVAFLVNAHVGETNLLEHLRIQLRALRLLEGRRLHFADSNLILERLGLRGAQALDGGLDGSVLQQTHADIDGVLLCKRGCR